MIALIVLVGSICLGVPAIRYSMLRGAGWMLVGSDPVQPADAIVIAVDADGAGTLEAADLFHSGVAKQVALFADPADSTVENEFAHRGIPYQRGAELPIRELKALGVENSEVIPGFVAGSEDEGPALAKWCDEHSYQSIVVVTTPDHSRRLRRMLRRGLAGHPTKVTIHVAHFSMFDPDRWWESHNGMRTEIEEGEKLLLDIVRHPFS
jgi:hypothetical protein